MQQGHPDPVLQQSKQFIFPESSVGLVSGAVRGVYRDAGDAAVAALTALSPAKLQECKFAAPTRHGVDYGVINFRWTSPQPIDALGPLEQAIKAKLQAQGMEEVHARRINLVAGSANLRGHNVGSADAVVADTDALSRVLKGDSRASGLRKALEDFKGRKMISFQTQAELFAWILHRSFSAERRRSLEQLLSDFEVVWPDDLCSLIWANLVNDGRALGRPAGAQDMWVAAIAVRHGAQICTANIKDYDYLSEQVKLLPIANQVGPVLPIQAFLREHGESELSGPSLSDSLFVVRSTEHPSLVLFNVKQRARTSDPGNRVYGCRGLILDQANDYRVVNYPYNSFFNLGEPQARRVMETLDWSTATIFPKLDGTLISMYYYGGTFRVSTRGHPDAASSVFETPPPDKEPLSFASLFWKTWEELGFQTPPTTVDWIRKTYCFELMTPISRVVVPVSTPRIVLTAVRDLDTYEELPCQPIADQMGWQTVLPEPGVGGPEELLKRAAAISPVSGEGFVVVDRCWARVKVKSARYVLASHLPRPNWGWNGEENANLKVDDAQMMQLVLSGESGEFGSYFPEWAPRFASMQQTLDRLAERIAKLLKAAVQDENGNDTGRSKKEIHAFLAKQGLPHEGLLGLLMKTLRQIEGPQAVPDKTRVLEILSEQKAIKVLFWSKEMSSEHKSAAQSPEVRAVSSSGQQAQTWCAETTLQHPTDLTSSLPTLPTSDSASQSTVVSSSKPILASVVSDCLRASNLIMLAFATQTPPLVPLLATTSLAASTLLVLPRHTPSPTANTTASLPLRLPTSMLAFLGLGAMGILASKKGIEAVHCWRRAQALPAEMQRLSAMHEHVYTLETLARTAILEGFLRRLARSASMESMVLRGSLLTRQFVKPDVRVAKDLDFLACFPWHEPDPVASVLERVCAIASVALSASDGVTFGAISGAVIFEETDAPGIKVTVADAALYGQFRQDVEIDVAFNDPQDPAPVWLEYEALPVFAESSVIKLLACGPEQMLAWKLHGLFEFNTINELGQDVQGNWRVKDLHDIWLLARAFQAAPEGRIGGITLQPKLISRAVEVAFASREQEPALIARLTSRHFGASSNSQRTWKKYRSQTACPDELPVQLHAVTDAVADFLEPLLRVLLHRRGADLKTFHGNLTITSSSPHGAVPSAAPSVSTAATPSEVSKTAGLDSTAMITELPGTWSVFRHTRHAEFVGVSYEEVAQLLSAPATSLMFGGRVHQFGVDRVKPMQEQRPGLVLLQEAPSFTMRDCKASAVCRRLPAPSPSTATPPPLSEPQPEAPQNAQEERALAQGAALASTCLARRLDVLPPLQKMVYVTSSRKKFLEARQCLAEWQQVLEQGPRGLKPKLCVDSEFWRGPEAAVRNMLRYCFEVLQTPCVLDLTFLEVADPDGGAPEIHWSDEIEDQVSAQLFVEARRGRSAALRSYVGYLGGSIGPEMVFEGTLEGRIGEAPAGGALDTAPAPAWNRDRMASGLETECWEVVFVPEGYAQPLVQLRDSSFCLGVRHVPLLELAHSLRGREYSQLFEVHVTVKTPDRLNVDAMTQFQTHCKGLAEYGFGQAVKPVLIENASGEVPKQMMTASYHRGSLAEVHLQAFRLSQALVRAGYAVTRTKIEALLSNRGVPITDQEAARLSPENYFEFHIKLRLPADAPLAPLQALAERHTAHLSRNPNSKGEDKTANGQVRAWQRRFVNLRMYQVGRETALKRFQACVDELQASGYGVERLIREYAVYDSNVGLDRGWIDKQ